MKIKLGNYDSIFVDNSIIAASIANGRTTRYFFLEEIVWYQGEHSAMYFIERVKEPWPEYESVISTNPMWSWAYAESCLCSRFPSGEATIRSSPYFSYCYVGKFRGSFSYLDVVLFENSIAKDASASYNYANYVLHDRWFPRGEAAIAESAEYSLYYAMSLVKGRWKAGEKAIMNSGDNFMITSYTRLLNKKK